jgi:hypothetical protein
MYDAVVLQVILESCKVVGNSASLGAAVALDMRATAHVSQCVLAFNNASIAGGALYTDSNSVLRIDSSAIAHNAGGSFRRWCWPQERGSHHHQWDDVREQHSR